MTGYRARTVSAMPVYSQQPGIDWDAIETEAADLLSRYLRFDTTNPPGNEVEALEFLAEVLRARGFEPNLIKSAPGRANLITRLSPPGEAQAAPCLLYAHADVVPADAAEWSVPPFAGQIKDGYVWGRGAIDNKGLGIIFLQVLHLLQQVAPPLQRDVILLIAADEEVCGRAGVAWLLEHHRDLIQAEYVWDEGGAGLRRKSGIYDHLYQIAVAEKGALGVKVVAQGTSGHASIPHADNPLDRLVQALRRIKRWQASPRLTPATVEMLQALAPGESFPHSLLFAKAGSKLLWPFLRQALAADPFLMPLVYNTINLTILRGGYKTNVIPAQAEAKLDIRLLPDEDPQTILAQLRSVISDPNISLIVEEEPVPQIMTPSDTDFFRALAHTLTMIDPSGLVVPSLTPGTTDSRFFRQAGMKAYGFMPMLLDANELNRIHGVDERVSLANLRWGMQVVYETLQKL